MDSEEVDATPGFEISPRQGLEVFVNRSGTVSLLQKSSMEDDSLIVLHPDEVRDLIDKLPKFLDENFPVDA